MPATLDTAALGQPVEIGQISRELKKLWERDSGTTTRASLINFAVYCEGAAAMQANTALILEFTREHACRAILIGHEPASGETKVGAWINAHCHLSRAGAKQVCCEQISFLFEGASQDRIANIVFSHLDSDLPLYFWWQGEFPDPIDEQLWAWVDRLIYDSQSWREPKVQFQRLQDSLAHAHSRLTLCDLNWTRSLHIRQALSQMFDHPENLAILHELERVVISHAVEYRSTALLLVGWLAAQLGLHFQSGTDAALLFKTRSGRQAHILLQPESGRSISRCELASRDAHVQVQRDVQGDFFRVEVALPGERVYHHLLPAGSNETSNLLMEEIGGGGKHRVYLKALEVAQRLL